MPEREESVGGSREDPRREHAAAETQPAVPGDRGSGAWVASALIVGVLSLAVWPHRDDARRPVEIGAPSWLAVSPRRGTSTRSLDDYPLPIASVARMSIRIDPLRALYSVAWIALAGLLLRGPARALARRLPPRISSWPAVSLAVLALAVAFLAGALAVAFLAGPISVASPSFWSEGAIFLVVPVLVGLYGCQVRSPLPPLSLALLAASGWLWGAERCMTDDAGISGPVLFLIGFLPSAFTGGVAGLLAWSIDRKRAQRMASGPADTPSPRQPSPVLPERPEASP